MRLFITMTAVALWLAAGAGAARAAVGDGGAHEPVLPPPNGKKKSGPAVTPSDSRGQLLYENHCQGCHTSRLHVRENRRARTIGELRGWVARWAAAQKLHWGDEEIGAVSDYLNRRYYRLAPPARKN